jgi:hypothetical protein
VHSRRLSMAEKREAADRVAAELLEEEEREEAAQSKVRVAPPSPHIELHSVQLGGERCGVSVARVSASLRSPHDVLGAWGAPQRKKGKGKAKAGSSGAGGGPSTKAAAAAGSSGEGSSSQGSSRPSAPPARIIGISTEEPAVQVAEAASDTQQTEPEPQPAGGGSTKKDKERQRKERQRQRKIEEASEALDGAMARMAENRGSVEAVEEAMHAAEKHEGRSEPLAALVAEAKGMLEQARAAEAERAKVAAEEAAVQAAVKATERLRLEEEMAALALSVQSDARRVQSDRLRLQQMQARLGVPPAAPAPHPTAEETMCVVCMDAAKDRAVRPCMHVCVCETCAQLLMLERTPRCPVCREPIQHIERVFF